LTFALDLLHRLGPKDCDISDLPSKKDF